VKSTIWFILLMFCVTLPAAPSRTMKYSSRSAREAKIWQEQVRHHMLDLLKIENWAVTAAQWPLNPTVISKQDSGTYTLLEIEIQSTPQRRIPVLVTIPAGKGRFPAVVCIHGHGGSRRSVHDAASIYKGFARELARTGYITIAADVGQHTVYENGHTLMGERLWDLKRCVDYLTTLPQTDKKRMGCAGLSLGGEMAMWLGAMDLRMTATVSSGFLTMMDQMEKNHCLCWKFDGLREAVDWPDVYALVAPRLLQCQNGLKEPANDFTVALARQAMTDIEVTYRDMRRPDAVMLQVHGGGHEVDLPALLGFFKRHL
jgi:hypothetical protein